MPMPPIEFHVSMFRDERDQARSQYVLLFLMEALVRCNQSLIRDGEGREKMGIGKKWPLLYRSGVHYEREPPGQEHWPDISKLLALFDGPGQYPGPWGDCEDLSCWRTAELREASSHKGADGAKIPGGVKARPFAKWRRGPEGQFNYHALVLRPDGKIEDPSLVLGMRKEAQFAADGTAAKLKAGTVQPVIQFAKAPDVMVVDPDSANGFLNRTDAKGLIGKPGAAKTAATDVVGRAARIDRTVRQLPRVTLNEAQRKLLEGTISSFGAVNPEVNLDLVGEDPNTDFSLGDDPLADDIAPAPPVREAVPGTLSPADVHQVAERVGRLETAAYGKKESYGLGLLKRSVKAEAERIMRALMTQV